MELTATEQDVRWSDWAGGQFVNCGRGLKLAIEVRFVIAAFRDNEGAVFCPVLYDEFGVHVLIESLGGRMHGPSLID
jgi:hypothetical protein